MNQALYANMNNKRKKKSLSSNPNTSKEYLSLPNTYVTFTFIMQHFGNPAKIQGH
jgi:hypothetical protein